MVRLFGKSDPMGVVESALKGRGWKYERVDAGTIITGVVTGSGRHYFISLRHEENKKTVLFLFNPTKGPADALQAITSGRLPFMQVHLAAGHSTEQVRAVCEILMHQNYRIALGNFERDHQDGEIRFRIALPYRDADPTVEQVNWAIEIAVGTLDLVVTRIERYLSGAMSFEEAIGEAPGRMMV